MRRRQEEDKMKERDGGIPRLGHKRKADAGAIRAMAKVRTFEDALKFLQRYG